MKTTCIGCVAAVLSLLPPVTARAETLAEVEQRLVAQHQKVRSYTARLSTSQEYQRRDGGRTDSRVEGTIEWMRKGDQYLYRSEIRGTSIHSLDGQESTIESRSTMISDGEWFYTVSQQRGETVAIKQKVDPTVRGDIATYLHAMGKDHEARLLGNEKVDDRDCVVIELVPRKPGDGPIVRTLVYYDTATGLNIQTQGKGKNDEVVYQSRVTDIKLNEEINPARFVFQAPPDVEVMYLPNE